MQFGQTISLNELIKSIGASAVQAFLDVSFRCDKNRDIEHFLLNSSVRFEMARVARTYLIFDDNSDILAYFSLAFKSIVILNTTKSQLKKLTGGLTNNNQINAYLIGQIGKNSLIQNNPVKLNDILSEIYPLIEQGQEMFGGRAVILECENNTKLIQYYEQHGFKLIETEDNQDLKTLYMIPNIE